jgi:hypothetical protein
MGAHLFPCVPTVSPDLATRIAKLTAGALVLAGWVWGRLRGKDVGL